MCHDVTIMSESDTQTSMSSKSMCSNKCAHNKYTMNMCVCNMNMGHSPIIAVSRKIKTDNRKQLLHLSDYFQMLHLIQVWHAFVWIQLWCPVVQWYLQSVGFVWKTRIDVGGLDQIADEST